MNANLDDLPEFVDSGSGGRPLKPRCGRCYEECDRLLPANCYERPETLIGQPLGMYHCPECGAMVLAGVEHPHLCKQCFDRTHPGFDGDQPRKGDWMITIGGQKFYPFDPRASEVDIEDIATSLSHICRFNGHVKRFYSVAEHSVLCSYVGDPTYAFDKLMHDAEEAYTGDLIRPIKTHADMETFRWVGAVVAGHIEDAMRVFHGMPKPDTDLMKRQEDVHSADNAVLFSEKAALLPDVPWGWSLPPADVKVRGLRPEAARNLFLARFEELTKGRTRKWRVLRVKAFLWGLLP